MATDGNCADVREEPSGHGSIPRSVVLVLLAVAWFAALTAPASGEELALPTMADRELVELVDAYDFPSSTEPLWAPPILGDPAADAHISRLAEARGYRMRPLAQRLVPVDGQRLHPDSAAAWERLKAAAAAAGHPIELASGHRTVEAQRSIFRHKLNAQGRFSAADVSSGRADAAIERVLRFSSIPGHSKHHTGFAVDLRTPGGSLGSFRGSGAFAWLAADGYANAKRLGFVPSYPDGGGRQGPDPEPWEYVYVGVGTIACAGNLVELSDPGPAGACPEGRVDEVAVDGPYVEVTGSAHDPDAPDQPVGLDVTLDGGPVEPVVRRITDRPDLGAGAGGPPDAGFAVTVRASPGPHRLCVRARNDNRSAASPLLGCRDVEVGGGPPLRGVGRLFFVIG